MPDDSIKQTLKIALWVCLVCSLLVSTAAVTLNAIQSRNKRLDRIKNILVAGDLYGKDIDIAETYESKIEPVMIQLQTGEPVPEAQFNDVLNIENYDIKTMAAHPEYGQPVLPENDIADIKRKPRYAVVYLVKSEVGALQKIVLPIYGKGLWSTLYGFLALESDFRTISGITFYEHGETPGLGGEIENPRWQNIWKGKIAYDENWNVIIEVLKGQVDPGSPNADHQIDGLSGATITTRGVDYIVEYWLGPDGYLPFLKKMQETT